MKNVNEFNFLNQMPVVKSYNEQYCYTHELEFKPYFETIADKDIVYSNDDHHSYAAIILYNVFHKNAVGQVTTSIDEMVEFYYKGLSEDNKKYLIENFRATILEMTSTETGKPEQTIWMSEDNIKILKGSDSEYFKYHISTLPKSEGYAKIYYDEFDYLIKWANWNNTTEGREKLDTVYLLNVFLYHLKRCRKGENFDGIDSRGRNYVSYKTIAEKLVSTKERVRKFTLILQKLGILEITVNNDPLNNHMANEYALAYDWEIKYKALLLAENDPYYNSIVKDGAAAKEKVMNEFNERNGELIDKYVYGLFS